MQVREFMTSPVTAVAPQAVLRDVALRMLEEDCGCIPVVESERVVGVITDRDIALRSVASGRSPYTARAADVMTRNPLCVPDDEQVTEAAQLMKSRGVRRLPVVDRDGRLCGILSLSDLARRWGAPDLPGDVLGQVSQRSRAA